MAASHNSRLQSMLQAAVQSVHWTYSLFWQICPQRGILIWGDGYYNGAIKTRKTVQPMEVSAEEASLQRSQQLRELYESLSAGETNQPARRPCAALSPEDLTESEWFYLMCVSFTFPSGVGLPGKAYARRQHVWLTGANEVDSKTFSRAILAKSARIQTVVCIPVLDGVVELGTTDKVQEDLGFVQHIKSFFTDHHQHHHHHHNRPLPPKPALSEHSTSNPTTSSVRLHSPPVIPPIYSPADPPPVNPNRVVEDDDDDDDEDDDHESDSEAETGQRNSNPGQAQNTQATAAAAAAAEPSELMQLEMSEDIRLGSPDDASNNLDSDFNLIGGAPDQHQRRADSFRAESARRWNLLQEPLSSGSLRPLPPSGAPSLDELTQEDAHYSQTVSTVLQNQPIRWGPAEPTTTNSSLSYLSYSNQSAFAKWTSRSDHMTHHHHHHRNLLNQPPTEGTSQWLLKYILFSVPYLHTKYCEANSPKSRDGDSSSNRFRNKPGGSSAQDELSANHVLAERRRREKLNERFIILRSLVPFVTKMDKASILGDTIEYVKQLRKKIQDLEARNRQIETEHQRSRLSSPDPPQRSASANSKDQPIRSAGGGVTSAARVPEKRKLRILEGAKSKAVVEPTPPPPPPPPPLPPPPTPQMEGGTTVEVSIIESDALIEMQCGYREGLLLDVMRMLRDIRIETTAVLSSLTNGIFVAELRAKVKDNVSGKKVSIMEVKRAINQIIPQD